MSSLELDRERVIQSLCAHFANDHLTTQELEARFDRAYKAANSRELEALTSNLPALPGDVAPSSAPAVAPRAAALTGEVASVKRSLALMSEVVKAGEWIPARKNVVHALMGTATIDLREALLSPGEIEFELNALMGEIKVIVPPGLRVACDGLAIMAEFREYHSAGFDDPGAPLVRIHGMAVMGSVTVQTRLPGETGREARRRQRLERRERHE
jgi:hypothetical protein